MIPPDLVWNARLTKTAGFTAYKLNRRTGQRTCSIELSTKVVDDTERLMWTLMHEMCHAAQWCVDGVHRPPHGATFKHWAAVAMQVHMARWVFWTACTGLCVAAAAAAAAAAAVAAAAAAVVVVVVVLGLIVMVVVIVVCFWLLLELLLVLLLLL
jgi:hypothetical protein